MMWPGRAARRRGKAGMRPRGGPVVIASPVRGNAAVSGTGATEGTIGRPASGTRAGGAANKSAARGAMIWRPVATGARAALGAGAVLAAAGLTLAACSAAHPQPAKTHQAAPGPSSGPVGTTLAVSDSSGTSLDVTVKQVTDPADGANKYSKPSSGKHFVGVKLRVHNAATTTYQNNANNETTIILSNGKTKQANYNPVAGCGNFDNGQVTLKAGTSSTGCVTFQVPNGEKVTAVRYGNSVFPGTTAEWHLP